MSTFLISYDQSDVSFPCSEEETILAAMIHANRGPIHHGCCGGGCGVCRMKILVGKYEKVKKMSRAHVSEADEKNGIVLLCCVQPRSNLIVSKGE